MRMRPLFFVLGAILLLAGNVMPQDYLEEVHLFQNPFHDASITAAPYGQAGVDFSSYDAMNSVGITAQGGYGITDKIEVNAGCGLRSLNFENKGAKKQTGLNDLTIAGRYLLLDEPARVSAGAYVTLPIGSEDVFASRFNFGIFGASRYALVNGIVLTGTVGLDFLETTISNIIETGSIYDGTYALEFQEKTEYENSVRIGLGGIYPINLDINAIGELLIQTEGEYMMLSLGGEILKGPGRIRAMIGLGIDDGAPNFQLFGGYLLEL